MELIKNTRLVEEEILNGNFNGIIVLIIYNKNHMDKIIINRLDSLNKDYIIIDLMMLSKKTQKMLDPGIGSNMYIFKDGLIIKHIKEFKEISNLAEIFKD